MSLFTYEAIREPGHVERGEIDAASAPAAASLLQARGYHIIQLSGIEDAEGARRAMRFGMGTGLRRNELTRLTRDMAALLKAGLPLSAALDTLRAQLDKPIWRTIAAGLRTALEDGSTFADALARYPLIFDSMYINLVRAGEESGRLVEVLVRLAEVGQKRDELKGRIRMALVYPSVMLALGLITVVVLLTFVVPMFTGVFKDSGQALPAPTQALVSLSHAMQTGWPVFLPVATVAAVGVVRFARTGKGKRFTSGFLLRLPVLQHIVRKGQIADFARTLATLLESGVPIVRGLGITAETLSNVYYRHAVTGLATALREGQRLSQALEKGPLFPKLLSSVVAVGEESGTLGESLHHVAAEHEQEIDRQIKIAMTLLEPLMIVLMGGMVGFIVMAMLLPIFALGDVAGVE